MTSESTHRLRFMHEPAPEPPFCRFKLVDAADMDAHPGLINDVLSGTVDGFVGRGLFTREEMAEVMESLAGINDHDWMKTPFGKNFPLPFAVINDKGASLEGYYQRLGLLHRLMSDDRGIGMIFQRLEGFLNSVGARFNVSVPKNDVKRSAVVPGTFRFMMPNLGGLFIHCGNLFQRQSEFFYSMLEGDVDMENQLSYFIVLQNPESGGELTLYDILWKDVQKKDHPENNEYVIGRDGERIYVKDLCKAQVRPEVGDILIFHGGPIWHRVEDIVGSGPRVTLGGFLNFSKDRKDLYYWS
jgi:hypothetical protein